MKYFLLFLLLSPLAARADIPDCWTVDGKAVGYNASGQEIADGQFLLTVEIPRISKEGLVQVMTKLNYGNLRPGGFPAIFEDFMVFTVEAIQEDADRGALIPAVNEQLEEIASIPGVGGMSCNAVSRPSHYFEPSAF